MGPNHPSDYVNELKPAKRLNCSARLIATSIPVASLIVAGSPACVNNLPFCPGAFFRVTWRSGGIGLRSGQFTCPVTLRTRLPIQDIWELCRYGAIGESSRPVRCVQVAKMGLGVSKTATDGRYRNSGASTNWSSRGSAGSRSGSSGLGGALAEANLLYLVTEGNPNSRKFANQQ